MLLDQHNKPAFGAAVSRITAVAYTQLSTYREQVDLLALYTGFSLAAGHRLREEHGAF